MSRHYSFNWRKFMNIAHVLSIYFFPSLSRPQVLSPLGGLLAGSVLACALTFNVSMRLAAHGDGRSGHAHCSAARPRSHQSRPRPRSVAQSHALTSSSVRLLLRLCGRWLAGRPAAERNPFGAAVRPSPLFKLLCEFPISCLLLVPSP